MNNYDGKSLYEIGIEIAGMFRELGYEFSKVITEKEAKQLDEELSKNNLEEAIRRNKQCQIEKRNIRKWKRYINK